MTLNMTYFHKYHMSYDLIASFIQQEMNVSHINLRHFSDPESLLTAAKENNIDIIIINSSCLFDDSFRYADIKKVLAKLCENRNITTIFLVQNMKAALLKKIVDMGVDIMVSSQDTPQELIRALMSVMISPTGETYISKSLREHLEQECAHLTPKEWEVMNFIQKGYTLSEIASKKCRAMSTISTQKRNAMNKLHLRNENELLRFLHQNAFF
ncbi:DNA-binding response regulator, NarL/FixJ family, contains REC and HTH domains [Candidatus Pantoea varia]|uniref:DNA-binding response regulator, NarL/FixJ family, contains REC and HTH domains n=1 Tax=Candidatus Pantoea varia TaxID=1881036 RepID=A0A1I5HUH8_9GAMM|nr:LuxR C-terminal-related transcriptional regulator [Pantoea varia]SFO51994.1 DNA-binding response regulator, NarL/FixJ family, contains REC and HTH domains [Pantoea varia]